MEEIKVLIVNRLEKIKSKLEVLAKQKEAFKATSIMACGELERCIITLDLSISEDTKYSNLIYTSGYVKGMLFVNNEVDEHLYGEISELFMEANQLWTEAKN